MRVVALFKGIEMLVDVNLRHLEVGEISGERRNVGFSCRVKIKGGDGIVLT